MHYFGQFKDHNSGSKKGNFIKKRTHMLSCEYCEICKNTYFGEHLGTSATEVTLGSDCLGLSFWTVAFKTILT